MIQLHYSDGGLIIDLFTKGLEFHARTKRWALGPSEQVTGTGTLCVKAIILKGQYPT